MNLKEYILKLDQYSYSEFLYWASNKELNEQFWAECPNPEWMLWFANEHDISQNIIINIVCEVVESIQYLVTEEKGSKIIKHLINTVKNFVNGKSETEEVCTAASTAVQFADGCAIWYNEEMYDVIWAAIFTARIVYIDNYIDAACAAIEQVTAAFATAAFATADNSESYGRAYKNKHKESTNIVRKHIPWKLIGNKINELQ